MVYMENITPLKYCLYARKSSESEERQMLSIDSQIKEMMTLAEQVGFTVAEVRQESHSAKASGLRPIFNELTADIRSGKFNAILTWAPDRISRNAGDLGVIVDLMDQGLLKEIRTPSQAFVNSPNDKFLLMILCSQAKLENDNRAKNILRGMKNKCEMGWRPCMAPLGYLNERYAPRGTKTVFLDPVRAPIVREMFEKVAYEGITGRELLRWLNRERGLKTRKDKPLTLSMLYKTLENPFYCGEFEYPIKSGKIYKGGHEPIITRELFLKCREKMLVGPKIPYGSKDFAFTRALKCGHCGHGMTASQRIKAYKNGNNQSFTYYHCTKNGEDPCRSKYIREDRLVAQLCALVETLPLNEGRLRLKVSGELKRMAQLNAAISGGSPILTPELEKKALRNYVGYVLQSGTKEERREILNLIEGRLVVEDGVLRIE
jgi:DNA invertase Pin-like site-specific DNA recombinase